ncbi:hypothetical protein EMCG_04032 [[Emmonsia] crescens]|uniref:Uncharacterized protein n=1 Tax=[Emmonsia] crescens TaxID=73230 RepID=A0A0G2HUA3_9EURO|nr:hypothetical protein EMCG_04032 [Emmonsia crescens UAMH 3008]
MAERDAGDSLQAKILKEQSSPFPWDISGMVIHKTKRQARGPLAKAKAARGEVLRSHNSTLR